MLTMTAKKILPIIAAVVAVIPTAGMYEASAEDTQEFKTQTARAPFSEPKVQEGGAFRSATGLTPTGGDKFSAVQISVRGEHRYVQWAKVSYFNGYPAALEENPVGEEFEISYYENGERKEERIGADAGLLRASQDWNFDRNIDAGPMCGRVKVNGEWSDYVCVDIKE